MRSRRLLFSLFLCSFVTLIAFGQQPPPTASVEGVVVDAMTNAPVAGVAVGTLGVSPNIRTTTGTDGHFLLGNLPAGRLKIYASTRQFESGALQIALAPGQELKNIVFRGASIGANSGVVTGRVLDSSGRPVVLANVSLYSYGYSRWTSIFESEEPSPRLQSIGQVAGRTNDRGEFRVTEVPAGKYVVLISGCRPSDTPPTRPGAVSACTGPFLGAVFHPAALDPSRAMGVEVKADEETRLGDTVLPLPVGRVRMRVRDADGKPLTVFRLLLSGYAIRGGPGISQEAIVNNGTTEVPLNFFGDYLVLSTVRSERARVTLRPGDSDISIQLIRDTVVDANVPGPVVSGRILTERQDGTLMPFAVPNLRVFLWDVTGASELSSANIASDGTFKFPGAHEGLYEVSGFGPGIYSSGAFLDHYIVSARQSGRNLLRDRLLVSKDGAELELILSPLGGIVRGRVLDGRGQAVANAVVAMRPEPPLSDRIDRSHTYRTERTDQNGVFEIRGAVPGDYRLFAWYPADVRKQASFSSNDPIGRHSSAFESAIEDGAFRSREYMKPFESSGKSVRVEKGGTSAAEVRVIDRAIANP